MRTNTKNVYICSRMNPNFNQGLKFKKKLINLFRYRIIRSKIKITLIYPQISFLLSPSKEKRNSTI